MFPDRFTFGLLFAGGEEKRYFAPMNDTQDGGPAEDQLFSLIPRRVFRLG
jgi:hypothetical protein